MSTNLVSLCVCYVYIYLSTEVDELPYIIDIAQQVYGIAIAFNEFC